MARVASDSIELAATGRDATADLDSPSSRSFGMVTAILTKDPMMQRLIGLFGGGPRRRQSPRSPGSIAWRPTLLAAIAALAALAIYGAFKYLLA
jgi:hypothetical protein